MTLVNLENNRPLENGRDGQYLAEKRSVGLGNTDPVATLGSPLGIGVPSVDYRKTRQRKSESPQEIWHAPTEPTLFVQIAEGEKFYFSPAESRFVFEAMPPLWTKVAKAPGQVLLFKKVMDDWDFDDREAATLLGLEAASDVEEIYLGVRPVRQRDANDRLRAILRIATDLDALFGDVAAIRDWLSEPQHDLNDATPRALLIEGSMENLLRVKYYVAYLSGR
jgi:hypothetical protein